MVKRAVLLKAIYLCATLLVAGALLYAILPGPLAGISTGGLMAFVVALLFVLLVVAGLLSRARVGELERKNLLLEEVLATKSTVLFCHFDKQLTLSRIVFKPTASISQFRPLAMGKRLPDVLPSDHPFVADCEKALAGQHVTSERIIGNRPYLCHSFPEKNAFNRIVGVSCIAIDQSEAARLNAQLSLAGKVVDSAGEAIIVSDARRKVLSVNQAFKRITGFNPSEVVGCRFFAAGSFAMPFGQLRELVTALREKGQWEGEVTGKRKNGESYSAKLQVSTIRDKDVLTHYLVTFVDISGIKQSQEELRYIAHHDHLTGMPNRRLFLDRLDLAIKRARRRGSLLALYFIDLDNFKIINDAFGHKVGDDLLAHVAKELSNTLRETDTIARFAGDEFTVVVEDVKDNKEIIAIAQKILQCFEQPFEVDGQVVEAGASVGISVFPEDGDTVDELISSADAAMYQAKESGKKRYFYLNEFLHKGANAMLIYPSELRMAIVKRQFELLYQPQVNLSTGRVVGCEALIRWHHHGKEVLLPSEFLPFAEEKGLINDIGAWVARTAISQFAEWRSKGMDLSAIAMNVSSGQMDETRLLETIGETLNDTGMSPDTVTLEIPELVALTDMRRTRKFIKNAARLNLRCAIDEFGSTGESYSVMKDLSVDLIKLDQKLLRASTSRNDVRALLSAIVALSRLLKFEVSAVGVEHLSQLDKLTELGFNLAQGYYFAKPMTAEQFATFYASYDRGDFTLTSAG